MWIDAYNAVTTVAGLLRSGRRLRDRRCRGTHPKWRVRELLQELWDGRGGAVGSGNRDSRWRRANRQRLHES